MEETSRIAAEDEPAKEDDLDFVFTEIGEFGRFQIIIFILIAFPIILQGSYSLSYAFTTTPLDYRWVLMRMTRANCNMIECSRCLIPECDSMEGSTIYDEPWLHQAIPFKNNRLQKCLRFATSHNQNDSTDGDELVCPVKLFNRSETQRCAEFVFKTDEVNIVNEFEIFCEENEYKLALVGTVSSIGSFVSTPIAGLLSDRWVVRRIEAIRFDVWNSFQYTSYHLIITATIESRHFMAKQLWVFRPWSQMHIRLQSHSADPGLSFQIWSFESVYPSNAGNLSIWNNQGILNELPDVRYCEWNERWNQMSRHQWIIFQATFFDSAAGACTYVTPFLLIVEMLSAKRRVLGGTFVDITTSIGEGALGFIAMYLTHFRSLLLAIYIPGLFIIVYFWLVPESVRWLIAVGKFDQAEIWDKLREKTKSPYRRKLSK